VLTIALTLAFAALIILLPLCLPPRARHSGEARPPRPEPMPVRRRRVTSRPIR
jgi:hypothetical protein